MTRYDAITDVAGIRVGHWTDRRAATGCTVIMCPDGTVGGVDVRGAAPGTRETDLLRPGNLVQTVNAILLSGGSAFGLDAATGVVRWCEEQGLGYAAGRLRIPIVPAAILFDLSVGRSDIRPDAEAGYAAAAAAKGGRVAEGSVGAGTGATVAKAAGLGSAIKGGIGSAAEEAFEGIVVAAIIAVNAVGEVMESATGRVVAGPRGASGRFRETLPLLLLDRSRAHAGENTTIGVVATNARLTKEQTNRLASVAHDGLARAIRPSHTMSDGDTIFALAAGEREASSSSVRAIEALAVVAVERAIVKAVMAATRVAGIPSARDWLSREA